MRQRQVKCSRCYRLRYISRMQTRPGRVADEGPVYVCGARSSCKVARKRYRRLLVTGIHGAGVDLLSSAP